MEDIVDADYKYWNRAWEDFEIKSLSDCPHLYVQNDYLEMKPLSLKNTLINIERSK